MSASFNSNFSKLNFDQTIDWCQNVQNIPASVILVKYLNRKQPERN